MSLKIAVACDHAGFHLKQTLLDFLRNKNIEFTDFGVNSTDPVDYPNYARMVCEAVNSGEHNRGLLVCGSGLGMSIAANKFPGIRCALIHDSYGAKMAREHNNANVIAFGERVTGSGVAMEAFEIWLNTDFLGDGTSHARRVAILDSLIAKN
ncbi:hypothetical protein SteCoe_5047 [Stentor coeruleus]|uniref:Ribose 5-phosphate isomerase B n=1 Tax=Stentor coeruleus TaxID=5963 RepID=A0A1R2CTD6_9CILI|nr:hypothetical protein SteCoe_5047 [Stentor coeruleus]